MRAHTCCFRPALGQDAEDATALPSGQSPAVRLELKRNKGQRSHSPHLTPAHSRSLPLDLHHYPSLSLNPTLSHSLPLRPTHSRRLPFTPAHSRTHAGQSLPCSCLSSCGTNTRGPNAPEGRGTSNRVARYHLIRHHPLHATAPNVGCSQRPTLPLKVPTLGFLPRPTFRLPFRQIEIPCADFERRNSEGISRMALAKSSSLSNRATSSRGRRRYHKACWRDIPTGEAP